MSYANSPYLQSQWARAHSAGRGTVRYSRWRELAGLLATARRNASNPEDHEELDFLEGVAWLHTVDQAAYNRENCHV